MVSIVDQNRSFEHTQADKQTDRQSTLIHNPETTSNNDDDDKMVTIETPRFQKAITSIRKTNSAFFSPDNLH